MTLKLLVLCLFIINVISVDPMPLPEMFTQSFTLSDDDGDSCTGKIFYDSKSLSQKISMIGNSNYCCDDSHDSCSYMLINGTAYVILTSDKLCCFIKNFEIDSIPRDVFQQYFTYQGEKLVDNEKCYLWVSPSDQLVTLGVFTDQTPKRIMKQVIIQTYASDSTVKFWPGSYSQKFSQKTTFQVPSYCTDECQFGNNYDELLKNLMKLTNKISRGNLHEVKQ